MVFCRFVKSVVGSSLHSLCILVQSAIMMIIAYLATIFLSIFSTAVMSYIAMATPIGPWIAPTLALISLLAAHMLPQRIAPSHKMIALCIAGGSIGGIMATAVGFYFPTLYFLHQSQFNALMARPLLFWAVLSGISFAASIFGLAIANMFEHQLLDTQKLPFAVGQIVHTLLATGNSVRRAVQLAIGFVSTIFFCGVQTTLAGWGPWVPRIYTAVSKRTFNFFVIPRLVLRFDQLPMLLAIGFIAGHVIALPLFVGLLSRLLVAEPVNKLFFPTLGAYDFTMAFCSGLVLSGAIISFYGLYTRWRKNKKNNHKKTFSFISLWHTLVQAVSGQAIELICMLAILVTMLSLAGFSWVAQLFVIGASAIASYQIIVIAGKIGLATMGRFATFVMVPALLLFGCNGLQVTIISTLVGVAGGVGTDVLFGRKMGQLSNLSQKTVRKFQLLGIISSCLAIGIVVWLLIDQFGLGSPELFAQRAQARALLINCTHFNYYVLGVGMAFGVLLRQLRVNGLLVLGGLLMPIDYSLALIIGGFMSHYLIDQKSGEPFWSGVFAANSIWMLLQALF